MKNNYILNCLLSLSVLDSCSSPKKNKKPTYIYVNKESSTTWKNYSKIFTHALAHYEGHVIEKYESQMPEIIKLALAHSRKQML